MTWKGGNASAQILFTGYALSRYSYSFSLRFYSFFLTHSTISFLGDLPISLHLLRYSLNIGLFLLSLMASVFSIRLYISSMIFNNSSSSSLVRLLLFHMVSILSVIFFHFSIIISNSFFLFSNHFFMECAIAFAAHSLKSFSSIFFSTISSLQNALFQTNFSNVIKIVV